MENKKALTLRAHAKINLYLNVGPRRDDGYHSIDTLFQEISLHDTLRFRLAPRAISLRVTGSTLSAGPDNLIVRALELLRAKLNISSGMDVVLDKKIPMGAGLGGGSSDAAAALLAGWALWTNKHASSAVKRRGLPQLLFKCAAQLGADVAFFLRGGRSRASGIGEKLSKPVHAEKKWLVLIYPRVHVSTPKAYGWIDESRHNPSPVALSLKGEGWERGKAARNDFEAVVLPRFPAIRHAKAELRRLGCKGVMMSGSGSGVFGFAAGKGAAERIKRALRLKPWDIFAAHTI